MTPAAPRGYSKRMDAEELNQTEIARMQVLIMKLASGVMTQNFTQEEVALLEKMRANKETILKILHEEMRLATSVNDRGREKINNLIRMVEKICK